MNSSNIRGKAAVVVLTAAAMAYLESACVVYLQRALDITPDKLFPLSGPSSVGNLAPIEVGREAATMMMLAGIGWLAGRGWIDRLAWTAVAFGIWDILYYAWLWVFLGWPHAPTTWDVLFLIPAPWSGPVWAPVVVSIALVGFGLAAARRVGAGRAPIVGRRPLLTAIGGGAIVIASFLANAPALLGGGVPGWFPWPVFVAGMVVACWAAVLTLRTGLADGAE